MMLEAVNIHKTYGEGSHKLHALKGVDLTIKEGDILSIIGPSGAGKSTLLHILGGLERPIQGQVILEGKDIYRFSDDERSRLRNRKIGFIFQFYHLLAEFTALENVLLPALVQGQSETSESKETRALDLLDRVGLSARVSHKPYQLSGGEQQRVAIARSLINDPKIIFCDEPTGNLDTQSEGEILKILEGLNRKGKTVVMVTHDLDSLWRTTTQVAFLADKRIAGIGTLDELSRSDHPALVAYFKGTRGKAAKART